MRQLYGQQFTDEEILDFKKKIQLSTLQHFVTIIQNVLEKENIPQLLKQHCCNFLDEWKNVIPAGRDFLNDAVTIWRIISVQKYADTAITLNHRLRTADNLESYLSFGSDLTLSMLLNRVHSDNPAKHFLSSFERIICEQYRPTLEDILNLRDPTAGNVSIKVFVSVI